MIWRYTIHLEAAKVILAEGYIWPAHRKLSHGLNMTSSLKDMLPITLSMERQLLWHHRKRQIFGSFVGNLLPPGKKTK